jgi:PAS domain-containing protein
VGRRIRLVGVALALAACGGGEETPTQAAPSASSPLVVDDGTLAAGAKIAAPKGEVVLTMTGDIGAANKGKKLELDLASLESMRRVRLEAAERALRASEERFRSLVQSSSDVISIVDADGAVRYHSESVRRVLGYDPGELVDGDPLSLSIPTTASGWPGSWPRRRCGRG